MLDDFRDFICSRASRLTAVKTKTWNRWSNLEPDLKCAISNIKPGIASIVSKQQAQKSN